MRAVIFDGPEIISIEEIPEPVIQKETDAIVKVELAAICGTDLHAYHGLEGINPGTVLGHEFVGTIVETGLQVRNHQVGQQVFGSDFSACGLCLACLRGDHWECPEKQFFGFGSVFGAPLQGAQADYVRVPWADITLMKVPENCSARQAIFVGDTLASGFAAVERGNVTYGDVVAVVGGGAVGQMVSLACQIAGAADVVVIDGINDRRLVAQELGAIPASIQEAEEVVSFLTNGFGADVVVDAVGGKKPLDTAFSLVRRRGTVVSVGAHLDSTYPLAISDAFENELSVKFVIGDGIRLHHKILPLITSKLLDPTSIVTADISLEETPEYYRRFAERSELKVLVHVEI